MKSLSITMCALLLASASSFAQDRVVRTQTTGKTTSGNQRSTPDFKPGVYVNATITTPREWR